MSKEATERNKKFKINRQVRLQGRPDELVSQNCFKSRMKRRRLKDFREGRTTLKDSPSVNGQRQFGTSAKGHHLHQRENHLATALTPKEFQRIENAKKLQQKGTIHIDRTEG